MKSSSIIGATGLLCVVLSGVALAQTGGAAQKETATAHVHALMAQGASSLKMSHTHLHHVINCLVGPEGKGFDAAAADPCKGMGHGALPDSKGDKAEHARLWKALTVARKGLATTSLKASHAEAAKAAKLLAGSQGG
ncbi:MAG TPA: hypothetical protein VF269_04515 [Rhodanobacteraceae bacterium]